MRGRNREALGRTVLGILQVAHDRDKIEVKSFDAKTMLFPQMGGILKKKRSEGEREGSVVFLLMEEMYQGWYFEVC